MMCSCITTVWTAKRGTTEDDLKQYYEENNARVRYIKFNLTDGNGEALDDAGKKDMKAKVEDYLARSTHSRAMKMPWKTRWTLFRATTMLT